VKDKSSCQLECTLWQSSFEYNNPSSEAACDAQAYPLCFLEAVSMDAYLCVAYDHEPIRLAFFKMQGAFCCVYALFGDQDSGFEYILSN